MGATGGCLFAMEPAQYLEEHLKANKIMASQTLMVYMSLLMLKVLRPISG